MVAVNRGYRFTVVPTSVVFDLDVTGAQFRVLAALASYAGEDEWVYPSVPTLADRLGVSDRAIQQHIAALVAHGVLERRTRLRPNKSQTSNLYRVVADRQDPDGGEGELHRGDEAELHPAPEPELHPQNKTRGTRPDEGKPTVAAGGDGTLALVVADHVEDPLPVETLRDVYPRHPATGKPWGGAARSEVDKAWAKLIPAEQQAAVTAVGHYAEACKREGADRPKHLSTWLNQRCWVDWQTPAAPPQPGGNGRRSFRQVEADDSKAAIMRLVSG